MGEKQEDNEGKSSSSKRKASEISSDSKQKEAPDEEMEFEGGNNENVEVDEAAVDAAKKNLKDKIKAVERAKLDDYSKNVKDNVKLHEPGWKDRYYTDKCKADDVKEHGGREHLFRSYVIGLCW